MIKKLNITKNNIAYYKNVKDIYKDKTRNINRIKLNLKK